MTSCQVGPVYHTPCTDVPEEWKRGHEGIDSPPEVEYWWEVFGDEKLNELETTAVNNSPNLYSALQRVIEARAVAGLHQADLYPQLNLNASETNSVLLYKLLGLTDIPIPGIQKINPFFRVHQAQYVLPLTLSYELDLWGRLRSQYNSAIQAAQAQAEDFHSTLLTLTSEVATNYFLLRSLDAQIELLLSTIDVLKLEYSFNESRYKKGLSNLLAVTQAEQNLFQTKAIYDDTVRQRELQENAIAALLGLPATCFHLESDPLKEAPPTIPPGVPCCILKQRPDIARLERTMASQHSLINSAYASFFPTIDLTSTIGYLSPDFKHFLTWQGRLWSYGGSLVQPLFDGGRLNSNLSLSIANFREASGAYQQGVIQAFEEVESALADLEWQETQYDHLLSAAEAATKSFSLSQNRFRSGLINYLEVYTNEQAKLASEQSSLNILGQRYLSTIQLIKALGGSWDCSYRMEELGDIHCMKTESD